MYSKVFCCLNKLYYARKQILARQSFLLKSRVTALPLAVDLPNLQLDADGDDDDDDYDGDDGDGDDDDDDGDGDDDDDDDDDELAQEMGHGTPCYAAHFPNLQHKTQQIFNNQSDYNLVDQILNVGRQKILESDFCRILFPGYQRDKTSI